MALKAKQLLQADELQTQVIDVPEWARDGDCQVMVRAMDALAMSRYTARIQAAAEGEKDKDTAARIMSERMTLIYVAASIVDPETGEAVFDGPETLEVLAKKNGKGLQRVFNAAAALNHDAGTEAAEDFEKNLSATADSSPSGTTPSNTDTSTPTP